VTCHAVPGGADYLKVFDRRSDVISKLFVRALADVDLVSTFLVHDHQRHDGGLIYAADGGHVWLALPR